tara:strand:- start:30 stop:503 length:474 start_codon:yes stop_codon:yes gene_type:complete
MGSKRVGLARTQALIENLKRDLQMNGSTIQGAERQVIRLTGAGASQALTSKDSGALVVMAGADASTITLPAVQAGAEFEVFAFTAFNHVVNGGDSLIYGGIYDNQNDSSDTNVDRSAVNAASSITLQNAAVGDCLTFISDGTNWYVKGWLNDTPSVS